MRISQYISLNFKKLWKRKGQALFLIVPVMLLVGLSVIVTSQTQNVEKATEEGIFGSIEDQATLIELSKSFERFSGGPSSGGGGGRAMSLSDLTFTSDDQTVISNIDNVVASQIVSSLPINKVVASGLFEDTPIVLDDLTGLGESFASLYTEEEFTYTSGEPIPIILSANSFMEVVENWGGKKKIKIEFGGGEGKGNRPDQSSFPIQTQAISYEREDLIGKEFTLKVGGLDALDTYTIEGVSDGIRFKKLTKAEIKEQIQDRKTAINKYWKYNEISKPISYNVIVVGIIEDANDSKTYIPEEFASVVMKDYIKHQLDARRSKSFGNSVLGSTFVCMEFDGLELKSGSANFSFGVSGRGGGMGVFMSGSADDEDQVSYTVPGLVVRINREDEAEDIIPKLHKVVNVYDLAIKTGDMILVRVASVFTRNEVVEELNNLGYTYQDVTDTEVFSELKSTLGTISTGFVVAFVALTVGIIIITMGKFVSESKKEIGIFRAIGATRTNVRFLFLVQSFLYVIIGYLLGIGLGILGSQLIANPLGNWFEDLLTKTIVEAFGVSNPISPGVFQAINIDALAIYSLILLAITVVISLIPAERASRISPVEAIRGE